MSEPAGPDAIFADPRLAAIYDEVDGDRDDLVHYLAMVDEVGARSVLDLGCGTGTLACTLALLGIDVVAVDPAGASLEVAQTKAGARRVQWIHGDALALSTTHVDLAVMTGNVAQVFIEDEAWRTTLVAVRSTLEVGGHCILEVRDPSRRAWEEWNATASRRRLEIDAVGVVETWVDLIDVSLPLVSFRHTYRFERDGATLTSDSTLRFRDRAEIEESLVAAGFAVLDVRDAPDRPGKEFVFVARAVGRNQSGGTHE